MRVVFDYVSKSFGARTVLQEFSQVFESGTSYVLLGPSGSGKSTILGLLSAAISPDRGKVTIEDSPSDLWPSDFAWVLQTTTALTRRTVLDNVMLGPASRGIAEEEAQRHAVHAVDQLGLDWALKNRVGSLSGGEKQRVSVARVLASKAPIILADEPTASLDKDSRDKVVQGLLDSVGRDRLLVIATHDPTVAQACDVQIRLFEDRILMSSESK